MNDTQHLWHKKPVDYWISALHDSSDETRWEAVDALRHIAQPSQTISLFIEALGDHYWRVRALAAHSLYDMAHEEELIPSLWQAVLPLANALSDTCLDVCLNAAYALELLGRGAVAALPQLREAARHGDDRLREAAADAISMIDG